MTECYCSKVSLVSESIIESKANRKHNIQIMELDSMVPGSSSRKRNDPFAVDEVAGQNIL